MTICCRTCVIDDKPVTNLKFCVIGLDPRQIKVCGQYDKCDKMTNVRRNIKKRGYFWGLLEDVFHKQRKIFKKSLYFNSIIVIYFTNNKI